MSLSLCTTKASASAKWLKKARSIPLERRRPSSAASSLRSRTDTTSCSLREVSCSCLNRLSSSSICQPKVGCALVESYCTSNLAMTNKECADNFGAFSRERSPPPLLNIATKVFPTARLTSAGSHPLLFFDYTLVLHWRPPQRSNWFSFLRLPFLAIMKQEEVNLSSVTPLVRVGYHKRWEAGKS